jgi:Resolvase, N terminal domain
MKAALYLWVSIRDGTQDTDNQRFQLRQLCTSQGWQIVTEYEDHESGNRSDRTQFRQMLQDASTRKWDLPVFWALDRFSREGTLPKLRYLELLESYGVRWRSLTEPWIDSAGPFREVIISLLASLARQERLRVSGGRLTEVVAVAAAEEHGLALKMDRSVWASGSDLHGQLGDGTTTNPLGPVLAIPLGSPDFAISTGSPAFCPGFLAHHATTGCHQSNKATVLLVASCSQEHDAAELALASGSSHGRSEYILEAELDLAHRGCDTRNYAGRPRSIVDKVIGLGEIRVISEIEELRPEFQKLPLFFEKSLAER